MQFFPERYGRERIEQQSGKFREQGCVFYHGSIVKGCVFEWCLSDGQMNMEATLRRILAGYFSGIVTE